MVKYGEDWHGLQTTKLENLCSAFQTVHNSAVWELNQ